MIVFYFVILLLLINYIKIKTAGTFTAFLAGIVSDIGKKGR